MREVLISVIVPCYNVSKFIDDCVASLNAQTYKNFEAIFVNDGSTDDTPAKLESLCAGRENYKIINKPNGGISSARNAGLAFAQGEYICFLDSDDAYRADFLEVMLDAAETHGCDCVVCAYERVKEDFHFKDGRIKPRKGKVKIYSDAQEVLCRLMTGYGLGYFIFNKLYSRSLLERTGAFPKLYDENTFYAEDAEFNYGCLQHAQKVAVIDEQIYYYRIRKGGYTNSSFNDSKLSFFKPIAGIAESYKQTMPQAYLYGKAYLCVMAMEMLFRMHKSDYRNDERLRETFAILTENLKFVKQCKYHPWWRRWFSPLVPVYFKMLYGKRLKG